MAEASNELIVQILRDVQAAQAAQGRDIAEIKTDLSVFKTEMFEFRTEFHDFRDATVRDLALMRASVEALREMIFQINVAIRVIDERLCAVEA